MTTPLNNLTDTWNNGATTFVGLKYDITNTASNTASRVFDFKIGGNSFFYVDSTDGTVTINQLTQAVTGVPFSVRGSTFLAFSVQMSALASNSAFINIYNAGNNFGIVMNTPNSIINFGGGSVYLMDDAANCLAQRITTSAQAFRVYNTFTSSTNFERGGFDWITTANVFRIRSEAGGVGGTQRIIAVDGFGKAGAPANTDIPDGTYGFLRDTSGAHTYLIYNNAGTIQKIELV